MRARAWYPALAVPLLLLPVSPPAAADGLSDLIQLPSSRWRQHCSATPFTERMERHSRFQAKQLTVHYTDTPKTLKKSLQEKLCSLFQYSTSIAEGHKTELWGDVPYHFYIAADASLGEGRALGYMPDSNTAYERDGHITIVVEATAADGLTPAQKRKLFAVLSALQKKFSVPLSRVGTHKDFAQTDCPGPAIARAVAEFKGSGQRCIPDRCQSRKPRCGWGLEPVNRAAPGSCCPEWRCEAAPDPADEEENPENDEDQ